MLKLNENDKKVIAKVNGMIGFDILTYNEDLVKKAFENKKDVFKKLNLTYADLEKDFKINFQDLIADRLVDIFLCYGPLVERINVNHYVNWFYESVVLKVCSEKNIQAIAARRKKSKARTI